MNEEEISKMDTEKLKVLKELLDSGIITQEEFDAKKKELLKLTASEAPTPTNDTPPVDEAQFAGEGNTSHIKTRKSKKIKIAIALAFVCVVLVVSMAALKSPGLQSSDEPSQQSSQAPVSNAPKSSSSNSNIFSEEKVKKPEYKNVNLGSTVSLDFVEVTIDGASYAQEIHPDNPKRVYSYLPDQDNETYIYAYGTIKNTSGSQYEFASNIFAQITLDDKYNYNASIKADEDGSLSYIYSYLDPLRSVKFYIVASVPDEIANSFKTADIKFGFAKNFSGSLRIQENECDYLYSVTVSK